MSTGNVITDYKSKETLNELRTYVTGLKNVTDLETLIQQHLLQSSTDNYHDLLMLILASKRTKNEQILTSLLYNSSLPGNQRAKAAKVLLELKEKEEDASEFVQELINNEQLPRVIKTTLLRSLHTVFHEKKFSKDLYFQIALTLTAQSHHHSEHHLDVHVVHHCTHENASQLLFEWNIATLDQLNTDSASPLAQKLIKYQPLLVLNLLRNELHDKKSDLLKCLSDNDKTLSLLSRKQPVVVYEEIIQLTIECIQKMKSSNFSVQLYLPSFIQVNIRYYLAKVPKHMIQLFSILITESGIVYPGFSGTWDPYVNISFPKLSISIENYVELFMMCYEKIKNLKLVLNVFFKLFNHQPENMYEIRKQRRWFLEEVIQKRIGYEIFLKRLLQQGDYSSACQLRDFPKELASPLIKHILKEWEEDDIVEAKERLKYLQYSEMTEERYDEFLALMKTTGNDVTQRMLNYGYLFECSIQSHQMEDKVLSFIEKQFTNEQLPVIDELLKTFIRQNDSFYLHTVPEHLTTIEGILNPAFNHLQRSQSTLNLINTFAMILVKKYRYVKDVEMKMKVNTWAAKVVRRVYECDNSFIAYDPNPMVWNFTYSIPHSDTLSTRIFLNEMKDILQLCIKNNHFSQFESIVTHVFEKPWLIPEIDQQLFEELFYQKAVNTSSFSIDRQSSLIEAFLKNKDKQKERAWKLVELDTAFLWNDNIQKQLLLSLGEKDGASPTARTFIDRLFEDEKSLTVEKLQTLNDGKESKLMNFVDPKRQPGVNIKVLHSCLTHLTFNQQIKVTKIILNDYLNESDVPMRERFKALHLLKRMPHTYDITMKWIEQQLANLNSVDDATTDYDGIKQQGAQVRSLKKMFCCLPANFGLSPESLLKQIPILLQNVNATNAKFAAAALSNLSRKLNDQEFFRSLFEIYTR